MMKNPKDARKPDFMGLEYDYIVRHESDAAEALAKMKELEKKRHKDVPSVRINRYTTACGAERFINELKKNIN